MRTRISRYSLPNKSMNKWTAGELHQALSDASQLKKKIKQASKELIELPNPSAKSTTLLNEANTSLANLTIFRKMLKQRLTFLGQQNEKNNSLAEDKLDTRPKKRFKI